jgi:hypothetical protein
LTTCVTLPPADRPDPSLARRTAAAAAIRATGV